MRIHISVLLSVVALCSSLVESPDRSAYAAYAQGTVATSSIPADKSNTSNSTISASQRWDAVLVGSWYVPTVNLLAYLVGPDVINPLAIADQTNFQITTANNGVFSGQATIQFTRAVLMAIGWQKPQPLTYTISGQVTPEGHIKITFTPAESGQPSVTGVGNMEFIDGAWRMTMQMASSTEPYVMHWAYMSKPPSPRITQSFQKWQWLRGTRWSLADTALPTTSTSNVSYVFKIQNYRNGYFWGHGQGTTPFSVLGTVTPEANVLLVITPVGSSKLSRFGTLERVGTEWIMSVHSYFGSPETGVARLLP